MEITETCGGCVRRPLFIEKGELKYQEQPLGKQTLVGRELCGEGRRHYRAERCLFGYRAWCFVVLEVRCACGTLDSVRGREVAGMDRPPETSVLNSFKTTTKELNSSAT